MNEVLYGHGVWAVSEEYGILEVVLPSIYQPLYTFRIDDDHRVHGASVFCDSREHPYTHDQFDRVMEDVGIDKKKAWELLLEKE